MRKISKAVAALTAGCMLLSTSAFAMEAEITELKDGVATVTITELGEGQSTILVLEGKDTAVEAASESNILYINQDEIVGGAVKYTVNLGANFEGYATVWAGGTNETATKVGLLNAPVKAKGITLKEGENNAADKTVDAGAVINLAAVLNPENAEDTITWTVNGASDAALEVAADAKSAVFTAPELTEAGTYVIKAAVSETIYAVVTITVNAKVEEPADDYIASTGEAGKATVTDVKINTVIKAKWWNGYERNSIKAKIVLDETKYPRTDAEGNAVKYMVKVVRLDEAEMNKFDVFYSTQGDFYIALISPADVTAGYGYVVETVETIPTDKTITMFGKMTSGSLLQARDATRVARIVAGKYEDNLSTDLSAAIKADVNNDGNINATDATAIAKKAAGKGELGILSK